MVGSSQVLIHCHAKINLALSIGRPCSDGMHPIASWFITINLFDELAVEKHQGDSVFHMGYVQDAPSPSRIDWPLDKDLTYKALRLLEKKIGRPLPTRVALRKRIPAGGGLGGGSSDAAGMLVAIDRLHDLQLGERKLLELGSQLGSDVPFFVAALLQLSPSAIVTGLGETIEPAQRQDTMHLALMLPGLPCPTGQVYRAFDTMHPDASPPDEARVRALAAVVSIQPDMPFNDLTEPALQVRPELRAIRDTAAAALGRPVHVSGSGSSLFAVAADARDAAAMAATVKQQLGLVALPVQSA